MKKVILSVAIILGLVITTNVQRVYAVQEQPSITMITGEDGFVDVKLQDLSEVVQAAIIALEQEYEINVLKYNATKQLTKVKLTKKDDQSAKTIFLDAEGKQVETPKECEDAEKLKQETPSPEIVEIINDNSFVNIKFEELNENVQNAVRTISNDFDVTSLKYNVEKKITEVKGTNKVDQTEKVFYLDDEGKEIEKPSPDVQELSETPLLL